MSFSETDFSPGVYEFKVQAYDVMGNRAFKSVFVELTNALTKGLMDVFNAPNPMKKTTTFHFKNLAVERETKINIYIYNQNGRLVQVLKNAKSGKTTWDGRDFYGRLLANGLYHYSVKNDVSATEFHSKQVFSAKQKLVISR
jgi:flagellar hook assembly protein FlgD